MIIDQTYPGGAVIKSNGKAYKLELSHGGTKIRVESHCKELAELFDNNNVEYLINDCGEIFTCGRDLAPFVESGVITIIKKQ